MAVPELGNSRLNVARFRRDVARGAVAAVIASAVVSVAHILTDLVKGLGASWSINALANPELVVAALGAVLGGWWLWRMAKSEAESVEPGEK